jgi:hypothetical protein
MAVASSASANISPATTTNSLVTISCGGLSPTIIGAVAISSATITVTSATWSLGGTPAQVSSSRSAGNVLVSIWAVPAPTTGNGSFRFGYSASGHVNGIITCYTGANQSTPSAAADRVTSVSVSTNITLTPANLTANDATFLLAANVTNGNWNSTTPSQLNVDNTNSPGYIAGYATGTAGVHQFNDGTISAGNDMQMAVRIQAAAAGGSALRIEYYWAGDGTSGVFGKRLH